MYFICYHIFRVVKKYHHYFFILIFIQIVNGLLFQCPVYEWEVAAFWPCVGSSKCLSGHVL